MKVLDQYCRGTVSAARDGNIERGAFSAGMIAGLIKETKPTKQIISDIMADADNAYAEFKKITANSDVETRSHSSRSTQTRKRQQNRYGHGANILPWP